MRYQNTMGGSISCAGIGLHTGHPVTLTLHPAPIDTGIVFIQQQGSTSVSCTASIHNLIPTELCTTLGIHDTRFQTVEHILSALIGSEVDNVYVELDAGEVPILDGSAAPFVDLIKAAGIVPQERRQPYLKVLQPIEVKEGDRKVRLEPFPSPKVTYAIEYDHPFIARQSYVYTWSTAAFEQELAEARTFGFLKEVKMLWSRGLGKGGSLENTVVLSEDGILNSTGLRFPDEFVRHKILDLIGDLALLGIPIIGHVIADRSGHALHTALVRKILEHPESWMLLTTEEQVAPAFARLATAEGHPIPSMEAFTAY